MSTNPQDGSRPTVVLVHGAFADASSWNAVIERLHADGVQVSAPQSHYAESPSTPPTSPAYSSRFQARSSPSATPTAVR
jgi:dienelactone hydrolase